MLDVASMAKVLLDVQSPAFEVDLEGEEVEWFERAE
jgi:hypothetical protein